MNMSYAKYFKESQKNFITHFKIGYYEYKTFKKKSMDEMEQIMKQRDDFESD